MAALLTPVYGTTAAMTMTLASLASDASLVAGRQSSIIAQTSFSAMDYLVGGKVTTGTSPTGSKQIEVWAFGSYDDVEYTAGAGATDANFTPDEKTQMRLLAVIPTTSTSNKVYHWGPFSIAQAFGGVVPENWGIYIVHNTGVALNATGGNHEVVHTPVYYQSA